MLRFDEIVFGPIKSRRLGSSLGINLLPPDGKLCNFDCIYCECGWNADGRTRTSLPTADDVAAALEMKLKQCKADGVGIDSITFSGNGEPTLHPDFPLIVDITIELRDRFFPEAKTSVLSNATMLEKERVFLSLKKIDNPILKLDAASMSGVALVNRFSGNYDVREVIAAMKRFNGDFILQTMFLRSKDFDSSESSALDSWMDVVRDVKPREVMVYTLDRETPDKHLSKITAEEMERLVRPLIDEGFKIQIRG